MQGKIHPARAARWQSVQKTTCKSPARQEAAGRAK
jgi:hypothetical protein